MGLRTHGRLFYLFVFLFLVLGPAITFYAYGWRVDFRPFRIVKVGGIFLKNLPTESLVKIDNKLLEKQAKKFLSGVLIGNLLPGIYHVKIEKENYYEWEATLSVKPSVVTETKTIILLPKKEPELLVKKPVIDFWVNESTLVYKNGGGQYFLSDVKNPKAKTNLTILFNNLKERVLNFPGYVPIQNILAQDDPNLWLVSTQKASYLLDVKKLTLELLKEKAAPQKMNYDDLVISPEMLEKASWYKGTQKYLHANGRLYLLKDNSLSFLEL